MVDVAVFARALLAGAVVAAAVMRLALLGRPRPWRMAARWSWAVGAGVLVASGVTDQWPHWPALEDRARFLTLLVPLTFLVETAAATMRSRPTAWLARLALCAVAGPILLHDSIYLADLNGPNSAEWSTVQATCVFVGLAILLMLVWVSMCALESRTSPHAVQCVLFLDALAAAVVVILSGYYRGGLLGLGLAAAIAGATLASYTVRPRASDSASLGMSVVGIFSVVLIGRFFGSLSTELAACLLLAPLLAWTPELPRLRTLAPGWRGAARLACVAIPLVLVVLAAQRNFMAASSAHTGAEPSATRAPGN